MLESHWYIACRARELGQKPLGVTILQQPVVVFRTSEDTVVALEDRCVHRNAPLSQGRVCQAQLECPYHGWRYDMLGTVTAIPALPSTDTIKTLHQVKRHLCLEQDGYVWVCLSEQPARERPMEFPYLAEKGWTSFHMKTRFRAAVESCLENFLDCPHATHVHRFWFRTPRAKAVKAMVKSLPDGAVAEYFEEPRENALVWWLLTRPKSQMKHTDRFIAPATSRVDYVFDDRRHYIITSSCTPINDRETEVYTVISFKVQPIGWFIRLFFEPLSRFIIAQDVRILELQQANVNRFGRTAYQFIASDLLIPYIAQWRRAIATNADPPKAGIVHEVELRL